MQFILDENTCSKCGTCLTVCPMAALEFKESGFPGFKPEAACLLCGHCEAVCPTGSARVEDEILAPPLVRPELSHLTPDQIGNHLRMRRSIRQYLEKPAEKAILEQLLDIARFAPSACNLQAIKWLVIYEREEVKKLAGMVIDWLRYLRDNPKAAARLADMPLESLIGAWENGFDVISRGAPHLVIAYSEKANRFAQVDAPIALTYLEIGLPAFGLGACWGGFFDMALTFWPPIQEALKLPEGCKSFGTLMVGYPKYKYRRIPQRNKLDVTWR